MAKLHVKATVIGASMSGVVAGRELRCEGHQVVVFESSNDIGGMWLYDPRVESEPLGLDPGRDVVHASTYQSLQVNVPRQLAGFLDYPFLEKGCGNPRSFPGLEEVLRFLRGFVEDFRLIESIRFRYKVARVEQTVEGRRDQWAVEWQTRGGEKAAAGVDVFEAVVVCNDNHNQPKIPEFPEVRPAPPVTDNASKKHNKKKQTPSPTRGNAKSFFSYDSSSKLSKDVLQKYLNLAKSLYVDVSKRYCNAMKFPSIKSAAGNADVVSSDGGLFAKDGEGFE